MSKLKKKPKNNFKGRYVLYKDKSGIHFIDIQLEECNSMYYSCACGDSYYIKGNKLYISSCNIDNDNSNFDDVYFNVEDYSLGTVLYATDNFNKVSNLIGLKIQKENPFDAIYVK